MTELKTYKASEFAEKIGVKPENLRDWRRRGIGIGSAAISIGGKVMVPIKYDDRDLSIARVMLVLYRECFELSEAFRVALHVAPKMQEPEFPRFAMVTLQGVAFSDDLSDLSDLKSMVVQVIDLHALLRSLRT